MRNDHDTSSFVNQDLADRLNPPPPMPTVKPAPTPAPAPDVSKPAAVTPGQGGSTILPSVEQPVSAPAGWEVDEDRLSSFANSVTQARDGLTAVKTKVEQMQASRFTPQLGTSPVGAQLEQKFADRLDAPLDNPEQPTTGGLRPMLSEAMRRMDEFIAGAEAAIKAYQENESTAVDRVNTTGQGAGTPAASSPPKG